MTHARIIPSSSRTHWHAALGVCAVFLLFLAIPLPTHAVFDTIFEYTAGIIGSIAEMLANGLGILFVKVAHVLIDWIAPYNDFIGLTPSSGGAHPVEVGWKVVRDLSNMFFIVILLVIAFATMFRQEKWNYKTLLPRLLVMAVLINFSRTITGFIIDASQVVMLTFVNAFQAAAGGNLVEGLGIQNLFSIPEGAGMVDSFKAVVGFLIADAFMAIALITIIIITITLAARIVMLWMITIMSPAAFLLSTFPKGQAYYGQWWDELIKWCVGGPVLAFFLWLALATMTAGGGSVAATSSNAPTEGNAVATATPAVTEAAQEQNIVKFIIGIMMLLFGVQSAEKFGAVGTGLMKSATGFAKSKGVGALKMLGAGAVGGVVGGAMAGAKGAAGWVDYKTGIRKKAFGLMSYVPGAKGFATNRLAKLQEAPTKAYQESEKAAAAAAASAPDQFMRLADTKPIVQTAAGDAEHAARLKTAISSPEVYKSLVKQLGSEDAADAKVQEWFNEYEQVAERSGNKEVLDGRKEIRKENPHLIQDEGELRKVVGKLGAGDALKMSSAALSDSRVVSALSVGAKTSIQKHGNEKQRANLAKSEAKQARVATLTPDQLDDYIKTEGDDGKKNITAFYDQLIKQAQEEKDATKRAQYMQTAQDVLKKGYIDPAGMRADQFTANDGAVAGMVAENGSPELLAQITSNKGLAEGIRTGLQSHRAAKKARGETISPDEAQKIAETLFAAGADRSVAFDNDAQLETAIRGPRGKAIIGSVKPEQFAADEKLRKVLVENATPDQLLAVASGGSAAEQETASTIAEAILKRARDLDASDEVKNRAAEIRLDPTLRRILTGRFTRRTPPKPKKPKSTI